MKKWLFVAVLLAGLLLFDTVALAQDAGTGTTDTAAAPVLTPAQKAAAVPSHSFARMVGGGTSYSTRGKATGLAPGETQKRAVKEASKRDMSLMTHPNKPTATYMAPKFATRGIDAIMRRKQIFDEIYAQSKQPQPAKGVHATFRGTPYKPTKFTGA